MEVEAIVAEEKMKRLIYDSSSGTIWGKQISPEALRNGNLALVDHRHVGKEPTVEWQYDVVRLAAEAAGLDAAKFSLVTCSDDANRKAKQGTHLYGGSFDLILPGSPANFDDLEIGAHDGHTRYVILNIPHIGQYKHPETGKVLFGKIRGDTDGVLRECCGKLSAVLKKLQNSEALPAAFKGLEHHMNEFAKSRYDLSSPAQFSEAMLKLAIIHMEIQTMSILTGLTSLNGHNSGHSHKFVVAEGIAINRHYKYDSPLILAGLYVVEGGTVHDLGNAPYQVADRKAAERLSKVID